MTTQLRYLLLGENKTCGLCRSSLHAMVLLHVHQAKALMKMHEGSPDHKIMGELRNATDHALRGTKV